MKLNKILNILLVILVLVITPFSASAVETKCVSPQETVTQFYRWYLNEIKNERYPLTVYFKSGEKKLKNWLDEELLKELQDPESQSEMDYDYFTDAQDFFDAWLDNIHISNIKRDVNKSEVHLSLGMNDTLRQYSIRLVRKSCWKIKNVQRAQ